MDASKQELGRLRRTADAAANDTQTARAEVSHAQEWPIAPMRCRQRFLHSQAQNRPFERINQ